MLKQVQHDVSEDFFEIDIAHIKSRYPDPIAIGFILSRHPELVSGSLI